MDLKIKVVKINGNCPVYQEGDQFLIKNGYQLTSQIPLCMHALSALIPFYNALRFSDPADIGLAGKEKNKAYVQCPDAVEFTAGGTAIFEISRIRSDK
jgi:uncharacterized repeat protein (TIGR04076 family)